MSTKMELSPVRSLSGVILFKVGAQQPVQTRPPCMDLTNAIEAGILTDYNPTSQRYECAVCSKVGFGDVMPHISSPQHKNSAAWEVIYAQNPNRAMLSFLPEIVREAKINDEIEAVDRRVFSYQCKICVGKRPFNGLTPLQSHLSGGDHHKNKRASNITMQMQNDSSPRPNYSTSTPRGHQRSSPSEYIPTDYSPKGSVIEGGAKSKHNLSWPPKTLPDSLQPPSSSRGSPAGGAFPQRTSPTSYSQDEGLPQEVVNALQSGTVVEKEKTSSWTSYMCKACNVPLTGLKPLMQHLDSIKHLKRITGPQMSSSSTPGHSNESSGPNTQDFSPAYSLSPSAIEALKTGVVEELDSGYLCKACNVPLTGPMPLSQHAESEKHRKKAGVDFPRSMARLQIQDASDSRVKDRNEQQTYQWPSLEVRGASNAQVHLQRGIQKVQTVSDSEIIDYRQYQGQQSQEDFCNEETETDSVQHHQYSPSADNSCNEVLDQQNNHGRNLEPCKVLSLNESIMASAMTALERVDYFEHRESSEFCQFITSELNKLDPDLCKKAKRKIQLVLFEYQDIQEQRDGNSSQDPWSLTTASYANTLFSPVDFISEVRAVQPIGPPKKCT
ncbi:uncharacterized protein [Palaemon carinicauda]|uniref:uncharacterized protein isoform X3 n=1 Tax=Palaemon carinicauda TaxID=392227 RepID=UPI0035B697D4